MIVGFFLDIIYLFINFLIGFLPVGNTFPTAWTTAIYTVWSYVNVFSFIVPVDMLVTCLAIAMFFHLFVFAWRGMHWIYAMIRGFKH